MFRRNRGIEEAARALYAAAVDQARQPAFFASCGVPDTLDGRFETIGLHLFLLLRRLRPERPVRPEAERLGQALFDTMFANMDESLREMGVGDLGVGARVKQMAAALYGRIAAYDRGLAEGDAGMRQALRRNLYGTVSPGEKQVAAVADYLAREDAALAERDFEELLRGSVSFGPPPVAG